MLCSIFFKSELTDLGVCVKNARKNYGHWWKSITVLRDINITVPTGIIYGLLGPSGCGKTTLLRCIAGRLELNRGEFGGQQRCVSLACALLQQPQLLILDEPTVGVGLMRSGRMLAENEPSSNAEHIPMALYNSEAVNGFSTGYLSLQIINKLNLDQIHLIC
ncbi:unnamed protein product [Rotaria sp. Silwood1]|nr:unnamed protein product [Rotaria sp. Silwood1]